MLHEYAHSFIQSTQKDPISILCACNSVCMPITHVLMYVDKCSMCYSSPSPGLELVPAHFYPIPRAKLSQMSSPSSTTRFRIHNSDRFCLDPGTHLPYSERKQPLDAVAVPLWPPTAASEQRCLHRRERREMTM